MTERERKVIPREAQDIGEFTLDVLLKDGALRDFPVLGSALGMVRSGRAIRDILFMRKLYRFLSELDGLGEAEIDEMRTRVEKTEEAEHVGAHLLLLLDRADDFEKPIFLARAFLAYLEGRLDYGDFARIGRAIDRSYIADLKHFRRSELGGDPREQQSVRSELSGTGLVDVHAEALGGASWELTPLGERFLEACYPLANGAVGVRVVSDIHPGREVLNELRINGRVRLLKDILWGGRRLRELSSSQMEQVADVTGGDASFMLVSNAYRAGARCLISNQQWLLEKQHALTPVVVGMDILDADTEWEEFLAVIEREEWAAQIR